MDYGDEWHATTGAQMYTRASIALASSRPMVMATGGPRVSTDQITSSCYSGGNDNATDDNVGDADNGDDNGNGVGRTSNLNRPSHIISNYHKPNQMHIASR